MFWKQNIGQDLLSQGHQTAQSYSSLVQEQWPLHSPRLLQTCHKACCNSLAIRRACRKTCVILLAPWHWKCAKRKKYGPGWSKGRMRYKEVGKWGEGRMDKSVHRREHDCCQLHTLYPNPLRIQYGAIQTCAGYLTGVDLSCRITCLDFTQGKGAHVPLTWEDLQSAQTALSIEPSHIGPISSAWVRIMLWSTYHL